MSKALGMTQSTYCNDPEATHVVETQSRKFGNGIYGYYTNHFTALRVRNELIKRGCELAVVNPYSHLDEQDSIHRFIRPFLEA
jgi:hypothetical protein